MVGEGFKTNEATSRREAIKILGLSVETANEERIYYKLFLAVTPERSSSSLLGHSHY